MNKILSLVAMIAFSSLMYAQSADDILGIWLTEGGKSKVEITKKEGKYYGKIIWLKEPNRDDGKPKLDIHNENEKLRSRTIVGINILQGFEWDDNEFEEGTIYDPENGKTYSCVIKFDGRDILDVRGYIGFSLIGRSTIWTRIK